MNKVIIFSHDSDIDGLGSVVLSKIAFKKIDYVLLPNINELEKTFRKYLEEGKLDEYSQIYVTDLALYDPSLSLVASSSLKDKVMVFDHHKRAIEDGMNRYPFTIIIEKDNKKRCGTELFYEYLVNKRLLTPTKSIEEFVELTRLEDTWEWKQNGEFGEKAHDLAILFNQLGKEKYIFKMTEKLSNNKEEVLLDEEDLSLIKAKKEEYENTLKSIISETEYFIDENNNKYGVAFAKYEYRNEIPEYIIKTNNPESIKYFIIVALDKGEFGQRSYRSIDNNFDVNKVAMKYGGGGHPAASCVNITKMQKEEALNLPKKEALYFLATSSYDNKNN